MRQKRIETQEAKRETATAKLMVEGIVKKERRPKGFFTKMKDDELIEYAKDVIMEKKIGGRKELRNADHGLDKALRIRSLLGKAGFERKRREYRNWASMSDEDIVEYAKKFILEKSISGREDLNKADNGLHHALRQRKLLGKVGLDMKRRDFASMKDETLVEYTKELMKKKGISGRNELENVDHGLYQALRKRSLLCKIALKNKNGGHRDWKSIGDNKLVEYAIEFMKEKGIEGRNELEKMNEGLYRVLWRRGLLEKVGFENVQRDWKSMDDSQLVEYTKKYMKEKVISGRAKLRNLDEGLYSVLLRRNLLTLVFSYIENSKQQSLERDLLFGLRQAPEAMEKFGEGK